MDEAQICALLFELHLEWHIVKVDIFCIFGWIAFLPEEKKTGGQSRKSYELLAQ